MEKSVNLIKKIYKVTGVVGVLLLIMSGVIEMYKAANKSVVNINELKKLPIEMIENMGAEIFIDNYYLLDNLSYITKITGVLFISASLLVFLIMKINSNKEILNEK